MNGSHIDHADRIVSWGSRTHNRVYQREIDAQGHCVPLWRIHSAALVLCFFPGIPCWLSICLLLCLRFERECQGGSCRSEKKNQWSVVAFAVFMKYFSLFITVFIVSGLQCDSTQTDKTHLASVLRSESSLTYDMFHVCMTLTLKQASGFIHAQR